MTRTTDVVLTALAPAVWGSTYYVITEWLPGADPLTLAMLRALPARHKILFGHAPAGPDQPDLVRQGIAMAYDGMEIVL